MAGRDCLGAGAPGAVLGRASGTWANELQEGFAAPPRCGRAVSGIRGQGGRSTGPVGFGKVSGGASVRNFTTALPDLL